MGYVFDTTAPKRPTNLTVNSDLLKVAKRLKINISATLEEALIRKVQQEKTDAWLTENKAAIEQYNEFIEENGVFSDGLRKF
jgi:antitoxin CcdA